MADLQKTLIDNLICWILLLSIAPILLVYRFVVDVILRIKFGGKYGGLLEPTDMAFCIPDPSKVCINTVLYIKSEKEVHLLNSFKKVFKEKVFANPEWFPKLTSSKHTFGNFPFWLKNGCTLEDVIRPLQLTRDKEFTEEYLKEITAKIASDEHPKNGSILYDIHVSEIPLQNFAKDGHFYYPVVARFHHSIADGTSLVALLITLFGDETSQNYGEQLFKKLFKKPVKQNQNNIGETINLYMVIAVRMIHSLMIYLDFFFLSLGRIAESNQLRKTPDQNPLHGSNYSGNKIAVWATEDHTECIPLIKRIKNRAGSKFICVVNTAISASMTNYFKKHCSSVPDYTTGAITVLLHFPIIDASKPVKLENKTATFFFKLPTTEKCGTLAEALRKVTKTMDEQIRYADALMSRFLFTISGLFPLRILSSSIGFDNHTFVITNVPGGSQIKLFDGCVLDKIVPIAPNFRNTGISFAFLSYHDKLNVGILVDKSLNVAQEDVQKIADDILYYIKLLDVETKKYYEK